jgi:SH3-like domain-containing protein
MAALLAAALTGPALAQSMLGAPAAQAPAPAAPRAAEPPRPAAPQRPAATAPAAPGTTAPARPAQAAPRPAQPSATGQQPRRPQATQPGQRPPQGQRPQQQQRRQPRPAPPPPPAEPPVPAAPAEPAPPPIPPRGPATGLPMPRFVPLRSDRVNMRVGPDMRFPIEWRYERRDLPVMIVNERDQWRRIRDVDGTEGWVHQSNLLPGRRTFLVRPNQAGEVELRRRPDPESAVQARLRPGVIGRLRACAAGSDWCEVQARDARGFVRRREIFGVLPDEELN